MMNDTAQYWANSKLNKSLIIISMVLTIFGCIIILATYVLYKDIRTASRHIIVCITISDLVTALANCSGLLIHPTHKSNIPCVIQSFIGTTAVLCSFLWTMMLAVFLYITIVKESQYIAEKLIVPWFHTICWCIPLIINIIAAATRHLGNNADASTAGWCWIKVEHEHKSEAIFWMFIDGKGIEILCYIVVLVLYIKIKIHLKRKIRIFANLKGAASYFTQRTIDAARHADKKLIFIPLVIIFLRMWGTIRFFLYVAGGKDAVYDLSVVSVVLMCLHAIGDNLQGAANCLLFCVFTPKVRNHIKESVSYSCKSTCRSSDDQYDEVNESTNLLDPTT